MRSEEEEGLRDCLDSLRTAPKNLQSPSCMALEAKEPRHLSCRREAFPSLTALDTGIESVLFEEGTAPKLELLLDWGRIAFSGLSCLPSLMEVMIHQHAPFVDAVQPQLSRNPNKPVLKFF